MISDQNTHDHIWGGAVALICPGPHTFFAHSTSWRLGVNIYAASQREKNFSRKKKEFRKKNLMSKKILKKTRSLKLCMVCTHIQQSTKSGSKRR